MAKNIVAHDHSKFLYRLVIQLADNEWGNQLMDRVASEALVEHRDKPNLVVVVQEHAGWFLSYTHGREIVDTANDTAVLSHPAREFWEKVRGLPEVHLGYIRRNVTRPEMIEVAA